TSRRDADVETGASDTVVAVAEPANVALQLVDRVEAASLDKALRQTQRHAGVVSPLSGHQLEGSATDHVCHRLESARSFELECGAEGVANSQPEQRSSNPLRFVHVVCNLPRPVVNPRPCYRMSKPLGEVPAPRMMGY